MPSEQFEHADALRQVVVRLGHASRRRVQTAAQTQEAWARREGLVPSWIAFAQAAAIETIVQDDAELLHRSAARTGATLDDLRDLGVDWVRITAGWSVIAPAPLSARRPIFDATVQAGETYAFPLDLTVEPGEFVAIVGDLLGRPLGRAPGRPRPPG